MGKRSIAPNNDMATTAIIKIGNPWAVATYPPMTANIALIKSTSVKYTPHSVPSLFLSTWRVNIAI